MPETQQPIEIGELARQAARGNKAAGTLALRETLVALNYPEEAAAALVEMGGFYTILVCGVVGAPLSVTNKTEVLGSISKSFDTITSIRQSGRQVVLATLNGMERECFKKAVFEGQPAALGAEMYDLIVSCRRSIPRISREQRLRKIWHSLPFSNSLEEAITALAYMSETQAEHKGRWGLQTS